jgi:ABC-type sugar transport system ATPase subunit
MSVDNASHLLECDGILKSFDAVRALRGASLAVRQGSVHGLVGHNGAGKSTLIRIISGFIRPDGGEIRLSGEPVEIAGRRDAIQRGIWVVPQELTVLPDLTVADNVSVGGEPRRGIFVSGRAQRSLAREALRKLGLERISDEAIVEDLRPSEQRAVMIATAVSRDCRLLILDEPTASLGVDEAEPLLELIEGLPSQGISVIYVSHRLDEIERLCDEVTVMRDGVTVDRLERGQFAADDLVGRMVEELPAPVANRRAPKGTGTSVRVRGLNGRSLRAVDLDIAAGAVTGFTGLVGSGAEELLDILAGQRRAVSGSFEVNGRVVAPGTGAAALRSGIGFLPESRARAAMLDLTVGENVLISSLNSISRGGFVPARSERARARDLLEPFGLAERVNRPLAELSGGNQQKVLMARLIAADVDVLVINDPTAGVDVNARADLHRLIRELAAAGKTVVVRCSEPEELIDLADYVYVMAGGRISASLESGEVDMAKLLKASATSGAGL